MFMFIETLNVQVAFPFYSIPASELRPSDPLPNHPGKAQILLQVLSDTLLLTALSPLLCFLSQLSE